MNDILIVASPDATSETLRKHLTANGYNCIQMDNASSVNIKLKVSFPDLIIINDELKGKSGFDICKKIRSGVAVRYIPILMLCSDNTMNTQKRTIEAGADDFAIKNGDALSILSKVKSLIRIKDLSLQLKKKYEELEAKNRLMDMQLKMAMNVQRSLIAELNTTISGVQIASRYLPAMEIGGDFYEVIQLNEHTLIVIIGDVSGLGISAALLTTMLNSMIKGNAAKYTNPAQFLYNLNNEFIDIFDEENDIYACIFYAMIDTRKQRIYYSNAGQSLPLHVNGRSVKELSVSGTPVGMMRNSLYTHRIEHFESEDLLVFYTDGLCDNLYKLHQSLFLSRIQELLLKERGSELTHITNRLLDMFGGVGDKANGYDRDDVSIIICKMPKYENDAEQ